MDNKLPTPMNHPLQQIARLTLATLMISATSVSAQSIPHVWQNQLYKPPAGIQSPSNRNQGGTRAGGSQNSVQRFTPLVPSDSFGVTTEAYPSFLIYAPQIAEMPNLESLEFSILDAQGDEVYREKFNAQLSHSVLRIDLPKYAGLKELEEGKDYIWVLEGSTDDFSSSSNSVAHGWVRRVAPSQKLLDSIHKNTSAEQLAKAYIDDQVWYDAIALLAGEIQKGNASPQIMTQWNDLLKSAEINGIDPNSFKDNPVKPTPPM